MNKIADTCERLRFEIVNADADGDIMCDKTDIETLVNWCQRTMAAQDARTVQDRNPAAPRSYGETCQRPDVNAVKI